MQRIVDLELTRHAATDSLVAIHIETERNCVVIGMLHSRTSVAFTADDMLEVIERGSSVVGEILTRAWPELRDECDITVAESARQNEAIQGSVPRISRPPEEIAPSRAMQRLRERLRASDSVGVVGPSASGKTILVREASAEFTAALGKVIWLDLADPRTGVVGAFSALARHCRSQRVLVVMDDFQSSPRVGQALLHLLAALGIGAGTGGGPVVCIVISWPDAEWLLTNRFGEMNIVRCDGADTVRQILSPLTVNPAAREELLRVASGDALVAELCSEFYRRQGRVPSTTELADLAFGSTLAELDLNEAEVEALRQIAGLGIFEIDTRMDLLPLRDRSALDALVAKRVLRRTDNYVFFGHRSLARLIAYKLGTVPGRTVVTPTVRLAVEYLRRAGPSQIKQTLDRLDLVSMAGSDDQFGAAFLAHCWTSVKVLTRQLAAMVLDDPTWGDNVGSATFAADALAEMGMVDEWTRVAEYVRGRWSTPTEELLPVHTAGAPAEADDFAEIRQRMIEEDVHTTDVARGADIDIDRFHRTWVLGLLLGFEARALLPDENRIRQLRRMARASQLPEGGFYPLRVPWVTARVCLGLSASGDTVHTNPVLEAAGAWLRRRPPSGPCSFGVWRARTGTWNTELETTAMVLLTLGRLGVDPADRAIKAGLGYLKAGRQDWYRAGKEIDCAQAIEAALVLGGSWRDFAPEIRGLLDWTQDSRAWRDARSRASIVQDESSKVANVTGALISVVWETVKTELPLLLQGFVLDVGGDPGTSTDERLSVVNKLRELGSVIKSNVRDREAVVARGHASTEVSEALRIWRQRAKRCESLLVQAATPSVSLAASGVVGEANALGHEVLLSAWEEIEGP